jgi:hypothetical protein
MDGGIPVEPIYENILKFRDGLKIQNEAILISRYLDDNTHHYGPAIQTRVAQSFSTDENLKFLGRVSDDNNPLRPCAADFVGAR